MKTKSNKEFLREKYNLTLTDSIYVNNNIVREFLDLNNDELIIEGMKINRNDYHHFFSEKIWEKLELNEKLKLLKWACCDYLKVKDFTFSFFHQNDDDIRSSLAFANTDRITINLEQFNKLSGIYALEVILHESVHVLDLKKRDYYLNKFSPYIPDDLIKAKNFEYYNYIMGMDINGKHFNKITKKEEVFDKNMQNDLLMLKNLTVLINPNTSINSKKSSVRNKNDFFEYIRNICYQVSPLEYRAFTISQKKTFDIMDSVAPDFNSPEFGYFFNRSRYLRGKKKQLAKYFNRSIEEVINDALVYEYNKSTYGVYKKEYICKEQMENWEKDMEKLWNSKFRQDFPSRITQWLKKDNNTLNI